MIRKPWEAKCWRWITSKERRQDRFKRDGGFLSRFWSDPRITPLPTPSKNDHGWRVEVELMNGQRVFYKAY